MTSPPPAFGINWSSLDYLTLRIPAKLAAHSDDRDRSIHRFLTGMVFLS
jgi:hypothetical protein